MGLNTRQWLEIGIKHHSLICLVKESIGEVFNGRKLQKIKALVRIDIKLIVTFNKHKELETLF